MRDLAFGRYQHCCTLVQGKHAASDEEWALWVDFVHKCGLEYQGEMRVLVFSAGGSPTPKQRKMIHELMPEAEGSVRAFKPERVGAALDYLSIAAPLHRDLFEFARKKHGEIALPFLARL